MPPGYDPDLWDEALQTSRGLARAVAEMTGEPVAKDDVIRSAAVLIYTEMAGEVVVGAESLFVRSLTERE